MPTISKSDGTSPEQRREAGWAIDVPCVWVGSERVQFKGGPPSWHPMIHTIGYAGIARTGLALCGPRSLLTDLVVYTACLVLAAATGKLIQKAKAERFSRVCSAILGMTGFALTIVNNQLTIQHGKPDVWTEAVVPLGAVAVMLLAHLTGETLLCWFPAKADQADQADQAGRKRRFRFRKWGVSPA
jgi:hypothetical protein